MPNKEPQFSSRRAFTLLEVLIVLGLMVLIGTIAFPSFHRRLQRSEVESAAKQLKVELAEVRLKAIETGVAQKFRFQPGSNVYELVPCPEGVLSLYKNPEEEESEFEPIEDELESPFGEEDELPGESELDSDKEEEIQLTELPDGILFALEKPQFEDQQTEVVSETEAMEIWTDGEGWSKPIMFFPNGRSTGAQIFLNGKPNYTVALHLRSLTGTATVGETRRSEQEQLDDLMSDEPSSEEVLAAEPAAGDEG